LSFDWTNKSVLITGGTGSLGKALTRYFLEHKSLRRLVVFSRDELKQFEMQNELGPRDNLRFFIGDVRDKSRLIRAMNGIDVVIHAAAMKQVPACEYNPSEAIETNINGTQNVVDAAIETNVKRVLCTSTDKAVSPANLYGATKLCAEKVFIAGNFYAGTQDTLLSVTRYGNVLGSRGSVIPLFQKMKQNGKVTITDERMTRFWLTLEQSVNFVIRSIEEMVGGEIFIPKVPSMRIVDLARVIAPVAEMTITGVRPGEKIHEELISSEESVRSYEFDDKYVILPADPARDQSFWKQGKPLSSDFGYRSDTNTEWIEEQQLAELIESSSSNLA
jgi:UDP-N-acetylglucosamine 4,6-dehydratase/5-epimerase